MSKIAPIFLAALVAMLSTEAPAQGERQDLMGTVEHLHGQQLHLRTSEGSLLAIQLDAATRYEKSGQSASAADLEPGVRVVIEADRVADGFVARLVRIGVSTPAESSGNAAHPPSHDMAGHGMHTSETRSLGIALAREASGTAWQPDATPMHGVHSMHGNWMFMTHGNLFAGYDYQDGDRGGDQFLSVNWLMTMASRRLAGGDFMGRLMLSLEPLTIADRGYPLLLQTGETFDGVPLHDRQHPHDLFMELAMMYQHPVTESFGFQFYAAPAGEPALGPVAFPHRLSASSDPLAPLGHHWQDSSHITFGVLTAGLFTKSVKLEGSWFNGREPDENRHDFDFRELDSYSGRVAVNPSGTLSLQASYAYLNSPEALEPETSLHRMTISAMHHKPFRHQGHCATTAVWGRNDASGEDATNSFLLESNVDFDGRNTLFGRLEYVAKSGHDLVLPPPEQEDVFDLGSIVLGYLRQWPISRSLTPGVGIRGSLNIVPEDLRPFYGSRSPWGFMVFARLWPARMEMAPMQGHGGD